MIKGWDEGILDMCVGEKKKLIVPANLAYGENGVEGVIHPGATLAFEITLLDILGHN